MYFLTLEWMTSEVRLAPHYTAGGKVTEATPGPVLSFSVLLLRKESSQDILPNE